MNQEQPNLNQELKSLEEDVFADAHSPIEEFELVTGYYDETDKSVHKKVTIKEISGEEEDILASPKLNGFKKINKILISCTESIGDFTDKKKIEEIISKLNSGDRYQLMLKIRELSLGKQFLFKAKCINPECGQHSDQLLDITKVTIEGLSDPSKLEFDCTLPKSGKKIHWRIQDGFAEEKSTKVLNQLDNILTTQLYQRIMTMDGNKPSVDQIKKLGSMDRNFLRLEFEKVEGKIDNEIIIKCKHCPQEWSVELDITSKEFFFPSVTHLS